MAGTAHAGLVPCARTTVLVSATRRSVRQSIGNVVVTEDVQSYQVDSSLVVGVEVSAVGSVLEGTVTAVDVPVLVPVATTVAGASAQTTGRQRRIGRKGRKAGRPARSRHVLCVGLVQADGG